MSIRKEDNITWYRVIRYEYDCLGNRTLEEQVIEEGIRRKVWYQYNKKETIQGNGPIRSAITDMNMTLMGM